MHAFATLMQVAWHTATVAVFITFLFFPQKLPPQTLVKAIVISSESYNLRNSLVQFLYNGRIETVAVFPWLAQFKYGKTYPQGKMFFMVATSLSNGEVIAFRYCSFMIALGALSTWSLWWLIETARSALK